MNWENFSYEGLEALEQRIQRLSEDVAYLVIQERTIPKQDELLGRFDLNEASALPYLEDPVGDVAEDEPALPYDEDLDIDFNEEELEDDDDEPDWQPSRQGSEVLSQALINRAACRWVREVARSNTVGVEWARFRVKVYGPKGTRLIDSGQFVCRNHDWDLHVAPNQELPKIPPPDFDRAAMAGGAKGIRALGDYYAQWGQIVLGSVGQLQGVNNAMLARLHRQLQQSRGQVDKLVGSILESRYNELQLTEERQAGERQDDARHALAKEALSQLGDAAKAFLTARGINPEMADVLGVLGSSPELVTALNDPDVRTLMQEPSNLSDLAQMLKAAAQQARAAREAAAGTSTKGATTTDNQQSSPAAG